MAILKEICSNIGAVCKYHRIEKAEFDFEQGVVHITVSSYADESYRQREKNYLEQIRAQVERYHELEGKEELTEGEWTELQELNICELEAYKYEHTVMEHTRYSLPLAEDVRPDLYKMMMTIIPEMKNGKEV